MGRRQGIVIADCNGNEYSIADLAKRLGVSRQRVHQKYQVAIELGVSPMEYITRNNTHGVPVEHFERCFDNQIHTLEFKKEKDAEAYLSSIKAYYTSKSPYGSYKTRRLENVVLMKFEEITSPVKESSDNE